MSKKKRKTKAEKVTTRHNFVDKVYNVKDSNDIIKEDTKSVPSSKADKVTKSDIYDLKKVGSLIAISVVTIAILAYLIYQTDIFTAFFQKFNVTY